MKDSVLVDIITIDKNLFKVIVESIPGKSVKILPPPGEGHFYVVKSDPSPCSDLVVELSREIESEPRN